MTGDSTTQNGNPVDELGRSRADRRPAVAAAHTGPGATPAPALSIIIPALDEGRTLTATLAALAPLRARGAEVIVADGGSMDDTATLARVRADVVVTAPRGRALQMNAGAARASGTVLLFLHADSVPPVAADSLILDGLSRSRRSWGRFDVRIDSRHPLLRAVAWMMNLRSRLTGIATGDQGIFVTRTLFTAAGGYAQIPLMEDIELTRRLKRFGAPLCLRHRIRTSARRWESQGILRTIVLMWRLRLAYWLGADPARLAARYRSGGAPTSSAR